MASKSFRRLLAVAVIILLAGCAPSPAPASTPAGPKMALESCQLTTSTGGNEYAAQCGEWQVLENRADPSGRKISLHVAVRKAGSNAPAPDPLFLMAGGPGEAATESFTPLLGMLDQVNLKRDIVLVDQRGTGQSHPLTCPSDESASTPVPGEELPLEQQTAELKRCAGQLDADPRWYTTTEAMRDLDEVRAALGYDQINLLGLSYGTRAALVYQQLFPEHVRTLVLDGVAPIGWPLGEDAPADAQRALIQVFERCEQDEACRKAFPDIAAQFASLMATLEKDPPLVRLDHPLTAQPVELRMTPKVVAVAVRLLSYSPETASLLPLLVHTAQTGGDLRPLAAQYFTQVSAVQEAINSGMYYAVTCAEDTPFIDPAKIDAGSYFDFPVDDVRAYCTAWPHQQLESRPSAQASSSVPTLLISGGADPVTPPENGEQAAAAFTNHLHLVLPGMGHGNFYRGCMPKVIQNFLQSGATAGLDVTCVQKIQPAPFFTSMVGPQP